MNDNPRFPLSDDVRRMKISMVGDMATGKTCLCLRFVKNLYTSCHRATVSGKKIIQEPKKLILRRSFGVHDKCRTPRFTQYDHKHRHNNAVASLVENNGQTFMFKQ